MDRGAWQVTFLRVTKSQAWLKCFIMHIDARLSVQFSCSVVSDSAQPHGLQHGRLPCPSPAPGAHSNSCPLSQWCHPTISSSAIPFSSRLHCFPASGSFSVSQFFTSDGPRIGVSASESALPMNIQDWFPSRWTGLISLKSKGPGTVTLPLKASFYSVLKGWLIYTHISISQKIFAQLKREGHICENTL